MNEEDNKKNNYLENIIFDEPIIPKDGIDGKDGDTGERGEKGEKGDSGKNGKDGRNGIDGVDGINGKDGSPESGEEIANKLNTLKEVVDISVIKGAITREDLDNQDKKVLEGMKEVDGRIKLIDQRWRGGGLSKISHDASLLGDGTPSNPLKVIGSGSLSIGDLISGSTNNSNLFVDSSGHLANGFTLFDTPGFPVIDLDNTYLLDTSNNPSVFWNNRILYANDGATQIIDWSNQGSAAKYYFASGILQGDGSGLMNTITIGNPVSGSTNYASLQIDSSGNLANSFQLFNPNGTLIVDFSNSTPNVGMTLGPVSSILNYFSGNLSLDTNYDILFDQNQNYSILWNTRLMYGSNGGSILDYSGTYNIGTLLSFDTATRKTYIPYLGTLPTQVGGGIDLTTLVVKDLLDNRSMDANFRQLIAADGSAVVMDWGSEGGNPYSAAYYFSPTQGNKIIGEGSGLVNVAAATAVNATQANYLLDATFATVAVDGSSHLLYASDGVTVLVDFSNSTALGDYNFVSGKLTGIGSALTALDPANITGYTSSINDVLHGDSSWGPIDLAAGVGSSILPVSNGGTGQGTSVDVAYVEAASGITPIADNTYTFDVTAPNTSISITTIAGIITAITIV